MNVTQVMFELESACELGQSLSTAGTSAFAPVVASPFSHLAGLLHEKEGEHSSVPVTQIPNSAASEGGEELGVSQQEDLTDSSIAEAPCKATLEAHGHPAAQELEGPVRPSFRRA